MNHLTLIQHLLSGAPEKSTKTIAPAIGATEEQVKSWIKKINVDKEFSISIGKGGGLTITGGIAKEEDAYPFIDPHTEDWVSKSIYRGYGSTKYRTKATHKNKLTGKWGTPDFTTICAHKFTYAAPSALEVVSVEVKHSATQFDVTAVYEALAHTRVSNYSVLFYYDPPQATFSSRGLDDVFDEIKFCCSNLGIGLVITSNPAEISSWTYLVMAERHSPDLRKVDLFLEEAFKTPDDRKWFKNET